MKKLLKTILVLTLLFISACAVTACGVESITIAEGDMPQSVYVVGSDLNLEEGKLTVKTKDGEKKVALSASGVSVKGYDKDTLGEQTLTVSYEGKKTELKVKVVERAVISGYVGDYFVGDTFDKSQGRMQITRDNGTQYSVFLKDEKVTIENFSSATASSPLIATAKYTNGEISYSGTFPVNVYAIDSATLKKPTKTSYYSHDTDINLVGGKLTLKGNNGAFVKEIALTKDMVSGFDLTKATEEHRGEPLSQTITVSYLNHTSTFKVDITYTDVTAIKENAKDLAELDWTNETAPVLTQAQGELAINTMKMYFDLSTSLKALITEEERLAIARPAMVYGYGIYEADLVNYEDAFEIDEVGDIVFTCANRDDTESVVALMADKTLPFYEMGEFLAETAKAFSTFEVYEGVIFADYAVYDPINFDTEVLPVLDFMVKAYDKLAPVADEWTSEELDSNTTYKNAIEATYAFIKDTAYYYNIYEVVSSWRTNGDYFDILYDYYYGLDNEDAIITLSAFAFPGELNDLFYCVDSAIEQIMYMFGYEYPLVLESSGFLINYFEAFETAEIIKNGSNAMLKDLYATLPLNNILGAPGTEPVYFEDMLLYLKNTEGGYQQLCGGFYGVDDYERLIKHYVDVMSRYFENETAYKESANYDTDMTKLLNDFVALTPIQQSSFLTTIHIMYNPAYSAMSYPAVAFDYRAQREDFGGEALSFFVDFISDYYESKLTSSALKDVFAELLLAVEYYSQGYLAEGAMDAFVEKIEAVGTAYAGMEGIDEDLFETYLKPIYDKYVAISAYLDTDFTPTNLGEYADEFSELSEVMINAQLSVYLINNGISAYSLMLSAFEKAFDLEKKILESNDADIINAYYYEQFNFNTEEDPYYSTYDFMLNSYRGYYITALTAFYGQYNVYNTYIETAGLREFMKDTYGITWTYLLRASTAGEHVCQNCGWIYSETEGLPDQDIEAGTKFSDLSNEFKCPECDADKASFAEPYTYDSETIYEAMNRFKLLPIEAQVLFVMFEGDQFAFYYYGLTDFFKNNLSENAATWAENVLVVETAYIGCASDATEETVDALSEKLSEVETAWGQLTPDEQAELTEVKAIYDYYVNASQELIEEFENQGATA